MLGCEHPADGVNQRGKFRVVVKRPHIDVVIGNGLEALSLRSAIFACIDVRLRRGAAEVADERRRQDLPEDHATPYAVVVDHRLMESETHYAKPF